MAGNNVPLLMALPQLLGARQPIQYTNYQPNMPMAAMPKVPQMGHAVQMAAMPRINDPSQQQGRQQSPFGGSGAGGMGGIMNLTGFNPGYYANKLFGVGQSSPTPFNVSPQGLDLSNLSLPNLASFGF